MTISVWRYSHLALAVSSFLFILLAAVTGFILTFEPISDSLNPYAAGNLDKVTLSGLLADARSNFDEVLEIKIEKKRFVQADVIDKDGDSKQVYLDATGKPLGKVSGESRFFQFVTTLHRSLFLHGLGRFFMGLTAFLLLLIALTGTVLVVRRQGSLRRFFSKVVRDNRFQFYHVVFGRIWLLPIIAICLTGIVLACDSFQLFENPEIKHHIDFDNVKSGPKKDISEFEVFRNTPVSSVRSVEFPFSDDPEDAFTVKLTDREWVVNQFTGEILSEKQLPASRSMLDFMLEVHTGRIGPVWDIALAIACVNILFFIYSGFAMTLKRRKGRIRNKTGIENAEVLVLAGSENGSTLGFAKAFHEALSRNGVASFLTEPDQYARFASARHIVVITSTYGLGEAPANAAKALTRIRQFTQERHVKFAVVGFGSHAYPDFCRFAYEVYNTLSEQPILEPLLEIRAINDKSPEAFTQWANEWSQKAAMPLRLELRNYVMPEGKRRKFTVVEKTQTTIGGTFLIRLQARGRNFQSGDLLNVYPLDDHRERQYSIGKIAGAVQLAVKLHENGLGSGYLYGLNVGDVIRARIQPNPEFHFEPSVGHILISNGTGIAPFLGMIAENDARRECMLYCGFRNAASFAPYAGFLDRQLASGRLQAVHTAYSREGDRQYVRQLLERDRESVASLLEKGGNVMICGSLAMQGDVLELLSEICERTLGKPLSHFQSVGQIKMDCY